MNAMIRREPLNSLLDNLFSDYFVRGIWPATVRSGEVPATVRARMDVVDKGDRYLVTVDLPGVRKEDIRIAVEGAQVSIAAESRTQSDPQNGEQVLHSERYSASYARSFELPQEVTEDGAEAKFEDGVLHLTLPKKAQTSARQIRVQ